jgi:hypothetical protein
MITDALSYDDAVVAYLRLFDDKRAVPKQPSYQLSELRGRTWFLRNIDGPLARVNRYGEVRTAKIE